MDIYKPYAGDHFVGEEFHNPLTGAHIPYVTIHCIFCGERFAQAEEMPELQAVCSNCRGSGADFDGGRAFDRTLKASR